MRIAVIAAQGKSGQAFVAVATEMGHYVRAGIRGNNPFNGSEHVETMQCDATDARDVAQLIEGCDAVVSLIGHVKGSAEDVQTEAMRVIINAMEKSTAKRIISLTGTGARIDGDTPSLVDVLLNRMVSAVDPARISDGVAHVKVLRDSSLDWTIIRVLKLTNAGVGKFALSAHGPAKLATSRREVANAILQVIEQNIFIHECPIIGRL